MQHKRQDQRDEKAGKSKANCFALLKRITELKMSIRKSSLSKLTLKRVASNGSIAPLEKNWIIVVIRWELNPINLNLDPTLYIYIDR